MKSSIYTKSRILELREKFKQLLSELDSKALLESLDNFSHENSNDKMHLFLSKESENIQKNILRLENRILSKIENLKSTDHLPQNFDSLTLKDFFQLANEKENTKENNKELNVEKIIDDRLNAFENKMTNILSQQITSLSKLVKSNLENQEVFNNHDVVCENIEYTTPHVLRELEAGDNEAEESDTLLAKIDSLERKYSEIINSQDEKIDQKFSKFEDRVISLLENKLSNHSSNIKDEQFESDQHGDVLIVNDFSHIGKNKTEDYVVPESARSVEPSALHDIDIVPVFAETRTKSTKKEWDTSLLDNEHKNVSKQKLEDFDKEISKKEDSYFLKNEKQDQTNKPLVKTDNKKYFKQEDVELLKSSLKSLEEEVVKTHSEKVWLKKKFSRLTENYEQLMKKINEKDDAILKSSETLKNIETRFEELAILVDSHDFDLQKLCEENSKFFEESKKIIEEKKKQFTKSANSEELSTRELRQIESELINLQLELEKIDFDNFNDLIQEHKDIIL